MNFETGYQSFLNRYDFKNDWDTGHTPLYKLYWNVPPQVVWFLSHFGLQMGMGLTTLVWIPENGHGFHRPDMKTGMDFRGEVWKQGIRTSHISAWYEVRVWRTKQHTPKIPKFGMLFKFSLVSSKKRHKLMFCSPFQEFTSHLPLGVLQAFCV